MWDFSRISGIDYGKHAGITLGKERPLCFLLLIEAQLGTDQCGSRQEGGWWEGLQKSPEVWDQAGWLWDKSTAISMLSDAQLSGRIPTPRVFPWLCLESWEAHPGLYGE